MGEIRPAFGPEDHDRIAAIVAEARRALAQAGFPTKSRRFPFVMHHALIRERVRRGFEGRQWLRHSEIAAMLAEWATERGGAESYAWQAVSAAVESMVAASPELRDRVPDAVRRGIASAAPEGSFLAYVWDKLEARRYAYVAQETE